MLVCEKAIRTGKKKRMIWKKNSLDIRCAKVRSSLIPLRVEPSVHLCTDDNSRKDLKMNPEEHIVKYFPELDKRQREQLGMLGPLYREWNARINVVSRQDIDNLYERHILHSLGIAAAIRFKPGTQVMDAGTGGGFPGVPLAIFFPDARFHLVDSTAKKLTVVKAIAGELGLKNVTTEHIRLEEHFNQYDFIVSRAVASLDQFLAWTWKNVKKQGFNDLKNGVLYLRGGEYEPVNPPGISRKIFPLATFFKEPFFETKYLFYLS